MGRALPSESLPKIVLRDVPIVGAADLEVAALGRAASLADGIRPSQLDQTLAFSRL
jgi:hypothetical protein